MATLKRGGSALSAQDQTDIRRDLGLGTAATAAASDFATAAQGTDSREWTAATVDQAEAEAGTATTRRAWTAQRVRQAIVAWWTGYSSAAGRALVTAADAAAQRTAIGAASLTTAQTTAGGINVPALTSGNVLLDANANVVNVGIPDASNNTVLAGGGNESLSGVQNFVAGKSAGEYLISGSYNTLAGYRAGFLAGAANYLTAFGNGALLASTGGNNSAFGAQAGTNVTTGSGNNIQGFQAAFNLADGSQNAVLGNRALYSAVSSYYSTAVGNQALYSFVGFGIGATAIGDQAAYSATTAANLTAIGRRAGYSHAAGTDCTYVGASAAYSGLATECSGEGITAIGCFALGHNTSGSYSTANGRAAGWYNTSGGSNSYLGYRAGYGNSTGSDNVAMGFYAGHDALVVGKSLFIGSQADYFAPAATLVATASAGSGLAANTYAYRVAFVLDGVPTGQRDSSSSTVAVSGGNLRVTLSSIPVYNGPKACTARLIYRTQGYAAGTAGDHLYFLAATIPDNTTTSIVDSLSDASLGAAPASKDGAIAIGFQAKAYKPEQMVIGSSAAPISEVCIGGGTDNTSPVDVTHLPSGGSGTNVSGAAYRIAGGRGTGSAAGGKVIIATAPPGSSGAGANALVDVLEVLADGFVFVKNATTVPSANPSGGGYFYVQSGALMYRGSAGTVTTVAPA